MPTPRIHETNADRQRAYRQRREQARRDQLAAKGLPPSPIIATMPGTARWKALHEQARTALETMRDEMQAYFDDRNETWQEGERGEAFQEMMDAVSEAYDGVEELEIS